MIKFILFLTLLATSALAQTRSIVPRADGEGSIGRSDKEWGTVYARTGSLDKITLFPSVFLSDDGTNLLRNGVLIAGRGSGFPLTNTVNADTNNMPGIYGITNLGRVQGATGVFDQVTVGNIELISGGGLSLGFEDLSGIDTLNANSIIAATNLQSSGSLTVFNNSLLNGGATIKGITTLTNNARLNIYNTNAFLTLIGDTITFDNTTNSTRTTLDMGGGRILAGTDSAFTGDTSAQNLTVLGSLQVVGTQTINQTTIINNITNINAGTVTNYFFENVYQTNVVFQQTVTYTNIVTTNEVNTYVNVGGSFTMGQGSTFNATNAKAVLFPGFLSTNNATSNSFVTATGSWDFTGANVSGLAISDTGFTNIVTTGSGNVVTNLTFGGKVVTQQLGNISVALDGTAVTGIVNNVIAASNLISAITATSIAQQVVGSSNLLSVSAASALYRVNTTANQAQVLSVVFSDGTTQTTAGVSGNTTVTNLPATLAYVNVSNAWSAAQTLPAGSTILGTAFGLDRFQSVSGLTTQAGSFLYPTSNVPALTNVTFGLFIGTNNSISVNRPDGTSSGGNARSPRSIDLQQSDDRNAASQVAGGTSRNVLIGSYRGTISYGSGNVILGGGLTANTISAGDGCAIISAYGASISQVGLYNVILGGDSGAISSTGDNNAIIGGRFSQQISGSSYDAFLIGNYNCDIITGSGSAIGIVSSVGSQVNVTNASHFASSQIIGSGYSRILSLGTDRTRNSSIISGWTTTNAGKGSIAMGYRVVNTNDGNLVFASWDDGTTVFSPVKSNTATFRVPNGFGINTNNPQESLHVDGRIQITGVKIYASGTNLYLTDGSTYTNRINVTPE